jgi:hypothetical protein
MMMKVLLLHFLFLFLLIVFNLASVKSENDGELAEGAGNAGFSLICFY